MIYTLILIPAVGMLVLGILEALTGHPLAGSLDAGFASICLLVMFAIEQAERKAALIERRRAIRWENTHTTPRY